MPKIMSRRLVAVCYCVFMVLAAFSQLKLVFSHSSFTAGDLFSLFPPGIWIYLVALSVGVLFIQFCDVRLPWLVPLTLIAVFVVLFPLLQYPNINHWDSYRHATITRNIVESGYIPEGFQYSQYPGAFILAAFLSETLGVPVLETGVFLASFLNMLIAFLLFAVGKEFLSEKDGWLLPMAYFAFSFGHYTSLEHYSPQLLGLSLYALCLLVGIRMFKSLADRRLRAILLLLFATLTVSHPFSALFTIIAFVFAYIAGARARSPLRLNNTKWISLTLVILSVFMAVSWLVFVAKETFSTSIRSMLLVIKGARGFPGLVETVLYNPVPGALEFVLKYYRYGIYGLFGFLSTLGIVVFWRRIEVRLIVTLLVGTLLGGAIIYFTPATFGVGRIFLLGGIPLSLLAVYTISTQTTGAKIVSKISQALAYAVPLLVIATFLVSNLYVSAYASFMHSDEIAAAQFVARKVDQVISIIVDEALMVQYFSNMPVPIRIVDDRLPLDLARIDFTAETLSLEYLPRNRYYYNVSFFGNERNLIYSNGLSVVSIQIGK